MPCDLLRISYENSNIDAIFFLTQQCMNKFPLQMTNTPRTPGFFCRSYLDYLILILIQICQELILEIHLEETAKNSVVQLLKLPD